MAIEDLLLTKQVKLRDFFTIFSKTTPCISFGSAKFWKSIENYNPCNEREIGKLKDLLHRKKIPENSSRRNQRDIRLRSYSCSSSGCVPLLLYSFCCFCFSNRPREVKKLCCRLKISSHFITLYRRMVPLGAKEHPQMDFSSSINARQRVMRCPICCCRSQTVWFFSFCIWLFCSLICFLCQVGTDLILPYLQLFWVLKQFFVNNFVSVGASD